MAGVKFDITGNANGFVNATRQAEAAAKNMSKSVTKEGNALDDMFKKLAGGVASMAAGLSATALIKQIVEIRGEFQQLEVAFGTMLKSKEKANQLMQDAAEFAATTPFDLKGVAAGIRQNLAYGASVENVIDEMRMLGDVAAGLSMPLNDLVYLYGTLRTSGRVTTIDIRQFAGRGIPIYEELAKVLGVAKDEVAGLVTAGKVGFADIEQAFKNMTSAGGMFYGLMADQSKTINGQLSNLQDNIEMMFNEIGKSQEGIINGAIGVAASLVENYEKIGNILKTLVVTYGTYRAAVIAVTAAQKAQKIILQEAVVQKALAAKASITLSNAEAVAAAKTMLLQSAQMKLMNTLKAVSKLKIANPYVAAVTAIGAVTVGLFDMAKANDAGAGGVKKYNKALEKENAELEKHKIALEEAFDAAQDEKRSTTERIEALSDLIDAYPAIFNQYESEEAILKNILDIKRQINEEDNARALKAQLEKIDALDAEIAKLEEAAEIAARTGGGQAVMGIKNQIENLRKERALIVKDAEELAKKAAMIGPEKPVFFTDRDRTTLKDVDSYYKKQKEILDQMKAEENADSNAIASKQRLVDAIYNEIVAREKEIETVFSVKERIKELQSEQENYAANSEEYIAIQTRINALQMKLPNAKSQDDANTEALLKAKEKEEQLLIDSKKRSAREREDIEAQAEQASINALADGAEKRRRQRALDDRLEIQEINRQKEDYIDVLVKREKDAFEAAEEVRKAENSNYKVQPFDEAASRERNTKIAEDIYAPIVADTKDAQMQRDNKEAEDAMNEYLKAYGSYQQKKLLIEETFNKKIEDAELEGDRLSLIKQKEEELYALEQQYNKTASAIQDLFGNLDKKSASDLDSIADNAEKALDYIKNGKWEPGNEFGISEEAFNQIQADPSKLLDIANAIEQIRKQADELQTPIENLAEGFKELFAASEGTKDFEDALSKIESGVSGLSNVFSFVSDSLASMGEALGNEGLQKVSEGIDSALNVASQTMSGAQAGAAFGPWGAAIGAAVGLASSLVTEISKAKDATHALEQERLAEEIAEWDAEYEKLGKSIDKAYSVDASDLIEQQNVLLEQKKKNLELMIAEEKAKKNVDDAQIKEWENQINGIETSIEENADKAKDAITGISFDSFRDNFLDALLDMEKGAEGLADTIEEDIRKAMYDALLTDDAFEKQIQELYNDLADAIEDGDTREIDKIKKAILNLYDEQETKAREIDERLGYESESTREASSKGIAQASQDTVDELNGRATAIQSHTFSINERMGSLVNITSQILARIVSIDGHTARLEAIEKSLGLINSDISKIVTRGIKVKA